MSNTPDINGWMPIASAPRGDGMFDIPFIDLWSGSIRHPNCCYDHEKSLWSIRCRYLTKGGALKVVVNHLKGPTHWRPLPKPPATNSAYTIL